METGPIFQAGITQGEQRMAKPSQHLIDALVETAMRLDQGADYSWGHLGKCNCGHLTQTLTGVSPDDIHRKALGRGGDWGEVSDEYCSTSGMPKGASPYSLQVTSMPSLRACRPSRMLWAREGSSTWGPMPPCGAALIANQLAVPSAMPPPCGLMPLLHAPCWLPGYVALKYSTSVRTPPMRSCACVLPPVRALFRAARIRGSG